MKKIFPKKFTIGINSENETYFLNTDTLPAIIAYTNFTGYIFTYAKTLPKKVMNLYQTTAAETPEDLYDIKTMPKSLHRYFNRSYGKEDDGVDLVLNISSSEARIPIHFIQNIVIRANSLKLFNCKNKQELLDKRIQKKSVIEKILKVVNDNIEKVTALESWVHHIITTVPLNSYGNVMNFPKKITERNLKKEKINESQITVTYDLRLRCDNKNKVYEYENKVITTLENIFEDENIKLTIYNNYNDILTRLMKKLDSKKLKYEKHIGDKKNISKKIVDENTIKKNMDNEKIDEIISNKDTNEKIIDEDTNEKIIVDEKIDEDEQIDETDDDHIIVSLKNLRKLDMKYYLTDLL